MAQSIRQSVRNHNRLSKVVGAGLLLSFLAFGMFQTDHTQTENTVAGNESVKEAQQMGQEESVQQFQEEEVLAESESVNQFVESEREAEMDEVSHINLTTQVEAAPLRVEKAVSTASAVAWQSVSSGLNASGTAGLVKWSTSLEKNTELFVIERSLDGERYEEIGRKKAAGRSDTQKSYQFEDQSLAMTQMPRGFYRIRQIGTDGLGQTSEAIEYDLNLDLGLYAAIEKGKELLTISYAADGIGPMTMRILSLTGETMVEEELSADFFTQSIGVEIAGWEKANTISNCPTN